MSRPIGSPAEQARRGAALLLAVGTLAMVGFISVTAFSLARTESQAGLVAVARVQARAAAEGALAEALLGWSTTSTPVTPGAETTLAQVAFPGPAAGTARVRALGGPVFAIRAVGVRSAAGQPLATVKLELLVLLGVPDSISMVHPGVYPRGWRVLP